MNDDFTVKSEGELDTIFGEPHPMVKNKCSDSLSDNMKEFIRRSPLICLSTIDKNGHPDVSPKGDAPGFVQVDEEGNLLIPDRPGNKLVFGFRNLLTNSKVGVLFIVPTMRETFRVKGTATITRDPAILKKLGAEGQPALMCTHVKVEECFFHCGKAMIRSNTWKPNAWVTHKDSLISLSVAKEMKMEGDEAVKEIEAVIEQAYVNDLY
ncbi:MAG: PPOX class probable FMN-dependent enzyme [Halieaceae bacterium]|jgi:PPOX class probable FMN-dependent enzyme